MEVCSDEPVLTGSSLQTSMQARFRDFSMCLWTT